MADVPRPSRYQPPAPFLLSPTPCANRPQLALPGYCGVCQPALPQTETILSIMLTEAGGPTRSINLSQCWSERPEPGPTSPRSPPQAVHSGCRESSHGNTELLRGPGQTNSAQGRLASQGLSRVCTAGCPALLLGAGGWDVPGLSAVSVPGLSGTCALGRLPTQLPEAGGTTRTHLSFLSGRPGLPAVPTGPVAQAAHEFRRGGQNI